MLQRYEYSSKHDKRHGFGIALDEQIKGKFWTAEKFHVFDEFCGASIFRRRRTMSKSAQLRNTSFTV